MDRHQLVPFFLIMFVACEGPSVRRLDFGPPELTEPKLVFLSDALGPVSLGINLGVRHRIDVRLDGSAASDMETRLPLRIVNPVLVVDGNPIPVDAVHYRETGVVLSANEQDPNFLLQFETSRREPELVDALRTRCGEAVAVHVAFDWSFGPIEGPNASKYDIDPAVVTRGHVDASSAGWTAMVECSPGVLEEE